MITFCNINDLEATKEALKNLEKDHHILYKKFVEIVHFTRALHFKYHYMGSLLMDEDPNPFKPDSVHESVLHLYQKEVQQIRQHPDFHTLKKVLSQYKHTGYASISHLLLGMNPESLVGATYIR